MKAAPPSWRVAIDADAGCLEAFEQAEEALAGDREGVAHAGGAQRIGDEPPDGARAGWFGGLGVGRVCANGLLGRVCAMGSGAATSSS